MDIVFLTHDDEIVRKFKEHLVQSGKVELYEVHSISNYRELYYNHTGSELSENVLRCINFYVPKIRKDFNEEAIFISLNHGLFIDELPHLARAFTNFYNLNARGDSTLLDQISKLSNKKASLKRTMGICMYPLFDCTGSKYVEIIESSDEGCMRGEYGKDTTLEGMFVPYLTESELSLYHLFNYIIRNYY